MPSMKRYKDDPEYRRMYIERQKEYYKNNKEKILKQIHDKRMALNSICPICKKLFRPSKKDKHEATYEHKYYELKQNNRTLKI